MHDEQPERPHIETLLVHGKGRQRDSHGSTAVPLVQSTSFSYDTAKELEDIFAGRAPGHVYSRISNPTTMEFERRISTVEDGIGALSCASGMGAITAAVLAVAQEGDSILSGSSIFGGTYSLFSGMLKRCGITTDFVDSCDPDAFRAAVTDRTRLIFVETIGNPKLDVPNISAIAEVAREAGVPLFVDSTLTTPVLVQPKSLGADVVIHSASKYLNGNGTTIAGVIVDCGTFDWGRTPVLRDLHKRAGQFAFLASLRNQVCRDLGMCLAPFNAFMLCQTIESLSVRMERHCDNAAAIARRLQGSGLVDSVRYPGLADHPNHKIAARQFGGRFGALLSLRLGSKERCYRFIDGLHRILNLANLGDSRTLVIHPASTFCRDASPEERVSMGVTDDLVRLSVGLEHIDDLMEDIEQSLRKTT